MAHATQSAAGKTGKRSGPLFIVLVVLLLMLSGALGYDYLVARGGRQAALHRVQAELDRLDADPPTDIATLPVPPSPDQIRQLLGTQPDQEQEIAPLRLRETYTWEGIFWRYDLLVEYMGPGRGRGLHSVAAHNRFRFAP
jgi:hypothetical protein